MPFVATLTPGPLDVPTLVFAAVCIATLLGLFLVVAWLQQPDVRALAWWGAAYLIGGSAIALWNTPEPLFSVPPRIPAALIFVACGMIWNGVRIFHGRRILPLTTIAGASLWLALCMLTDRGSNTRLVIGAGIVSSYTFFIAFELWRERRKSLFSRTAAVIVPLLHAMIFLMPFVLKTLLPSDFVADWVAVFALETMIYAVGTAFVVLLMVKDHHLHVQKNAAATDHLTGLFNRRAFFESAKSLCAHQAERRAPITLLMFDLDHFKSINDRFGHAVGDDVLRVFAKVARSSMRATDVIARLGGEEFAAIVPGNPESATIIAERLRSSFESAGVTVAGHAVGATVSIGVACTPDPVEDIDALIARADEALYQAKHSGRNRVNIAEVPPAQTQPEVAPDSYRVPPAKTAKSAEKPAAAQPATPRLLYRR